MEEIKTKKENNPEGKRKVCPFLPRTSVEGNGTQALTRTWFPRCLGEKCAAYSPVSGSRAFCLRLGGEVILRETGEGTEKLWDEIVRGYRDRESPEGLRLVSDPEPE